MTTLFSQPKTPETRVAAIRGRLSRIALWTLQIGASAMFLFAGGLKLAGVPQMVATFEAIDLGQWFRYATGAIEVASALALLVPPLASFGALVLIPTMVGAVATHLFVIGGSAAPAAVLLIASIAIAWARRGEATAALSRLRTNLPTAGAHAQTSW
jgi:putative oxidoreductase